MGERAMKPRERWLAALRLEPVDRLPFWPKLNAAYPRGQRLPFRDMELEAIHDWIGSDKHVAIPGCIKEVRRRTSVETSTCDGMQRTLFKTPCGTAEAVNKFDARSQSWHPVKFPVQGREQIGIMTELFRDCAVELDREGLEKARARARELDQEAVTSNGVGESPLMYWVEWLAGVENAHYMLHDYRAEVEELFEQMHRVLLRKMELTCENSPCDLLYLGENTSTTLISPSQYRTYCYRYIEEYARIARDAGRLLVLHMCGHLEALLPHLARLPVAAFEAFTTAPVGNTSLAQGRAACPDKCLIGGTNAVLWTRRAGEIIARLEQELGRLPHHRGIVVTSAGVMPPLCRPETIKAVCEWVKGYQTRV